MSFLLAVHGIVTRPPYFRDEDENARPRYIMPFNPTKVCVVDQDSYSANNLLIERNIEESEELTNLKRDLMNVREIMYSGHPLPIFKDDKINAVLRAQRRIHLMGENDNMIRPDSIILLTESGDARARYYQ